MKTDTHETIVISITQADADQAEAYTNRCCLLATAIRRQLAPDTVSVIPQRASIDGRRFDFSEEDELRIHRAYGRVHFGEVKVHCWRYDDGGTPADLRKHFQPFSVTLSEVRNLEP